MTGQLVWLITGAGEGIGKELAKAVLRRGDKVIATTRSVSVSKLDELKALGAATLALDVEAPLEEIKEIAKKALAIYGQVDVVVNNAAYLLVGTVEYTTPQETYDHFNVNVFGALNVARAFLPHMRQRKTGTIIWASSIVGWTVPVTTGIYGATKSALRGISVSLHSEIAPLGLRSIAIDLGFYRTNILAFDNVRFSSGNDKCADYTPTLEGTKQFLKGFHGNEPGDPVKAGEVLVDLVRGEGAAAGREVPTLISLGPDTLDAIGGVTDTYAKTREEWKDVIVSTGY